MKTHSSRAARPLKELQAKTREVHRRLCRRFGRPRRERREDPLESMVWTILSQNTNDVLSERAYRSLRKTFPRWETMLAAPTAKIARAIRIGGLANQKSRTIKSLLKWSRRTYGRLNLDAMRKMSPAEAVETFTRIRGIGLKTVYVTLMFACGRDVFPVDTHIYRIVRRLALVSEKSSRDKTAERMQPIVPKGEALPFHLNLIRFGREVCKAQNPRCYDCPLVDLCFYPAKNLVPPATAE